MKNSKNKFEAYLDWLEENRSLFGHEPERERPSKPPKPGQVLQHEYLDKRSLTQTELAKMIGCTHAKVNEVVNGKRGITPSFALALEAALDVSAEYWLSLNTTYELWKLRTNL